VLVVCPTHKEGEEITQDIRKRLKAEGLIGEEEKTFLALKPLGWTDAERGDASRYDGSEVIQFNRNSGKYFAGERVAAAEFHPGEASKPEDYTVYAPGEISVAKGDMIRITANGRDKSQKHKLNNGSIYRIKSFTKKGEITLQNGWVLAKDFGHITHGRVVTSHASQGMTVDRVLVAMGQQSLPAVSREQFYVSVSRARQKATVFTNIAREQFREAIQRGDDRMTATEFMQAEDAKEKPEEFDRMLKYREDTRRSYRHLQMMNEHNARIAAEQQRQLQRKQQKEVGHAR
jgi:ATP-dependent exoDNAse (exonuclease V) alpha subunit